MRFSPAARFGWALPFGDWYDYTVDLVPSDRDHRAATVLQKHVRHVARRRKRREVIRRAWMAREEQKQRSVIPMLSKDAQKRMCTLMVMHTKRFVCIMNPYRNTVAHLYEDIAQITKLRDFRVSIQGRSVHRWRRKKLYHVGASAGGIYIVKLDY
tara:strand:+ start:1625 stop:2089 length:465 start_codon:yes stop_codon:yes gene_type:complete